MINGLCHSGNWGSLGNLGEWGWIGLILNLVLWVGLLAGVTLLVVRGIRHGTGVIAQLVEGGNPFDEQDCRRGGVKELEDGAGRYFRVREIATNAPLRARRSAAPSRTLSAGGACGSWPRRSRRPESSRKPPPRATPTSRGTSSASPPCCRGKTSRP